MRPALAAGLLLTGACTNGGGGTGDPAVVRLEARVAALERRLADMPAEAVSVQDASFEELARRLGSEDALERLRAGRALGPRLLEWRLDALRLLRDGTLRQREAVAVVLASRADASMAPGLVEALATAKEPRVRTFVVRALGRTAAAEAVEPVIAELGHEDDLVRLAAVEALGRLGDPRAAAPLAWLVASGEGVAADSAAASLSRLGDAVAPQLAASWGTHGPRERRAIVSALSRVEGPAVDAFLLERLEDPAALVALEAARVLAARGNLAGRELAIERLKSEDPGVAQAARAVLDAIEAAP